MNGIMERSDSHALRCLIESAVLEAAEIKGSPKVGVILRTQTRNEGRAVFYVYGYDRKRDCFLAYARGETAGGEIVREQMAVAYSDLEHRPVVFEVIKKKKLKKILKKIREEDAEKARIRKRNTERLQIQQPKKMDYFNSPFCTD